MTVVGRKEEEYLLWEVLAVGVAINSAPQYISEVDYHQWGEYRRQYWIIWARELEGGFRFCFR